MEQLNNIENREKMAELIKENIYVDNLLMTAATPEEALQHCNKAQQISAEMNMNLREFRTSCSIVNQCLPENKLSQSGKPKVLGLKWIPEEDAFELQWSYPKKPIVTKRTVSEQVAPIYDLLG
uniref:Integrase n=1 Tax=Haemonchus contortus TaxID=6289 RepID=A0A7I5E955_HAECO